MDYDSINIGFVNLSIGHWDLLGPHLQSIYDTYPHPKEFYIIPNFGKPMSLSAAINKGFHRALNDKVDYICYSADDVILAPQDVYNMIQKIEDENLWVCRTHSVDSSGYFNFMVKPEVFSQIGFWDESFYPAYFEDNDWDYRLRMKDPTKVADCFVNANHLGSISVKRMDKQELKVHHDAFRENRERYIKKWGGEPGQEKFTTPFNEKFDYPGF